MGASFGDGVEVTQAVRVAAFHNLVLFYLPTLYMFFCILFYGFGP